MHLKMNIMQQWKKECTHNAIKYKIIIIKLTAKPHSTNIDGSSSGWYTKRIHKKTNKKRWTTKKRERHNNKEELLVEKFQSESASIPIAIDWIKFGVFFFNFENW